MLQDLNNRHFTHGPSRHGGALRELSHATIKNPTEKTFLQMVNLNITKTRSSVPCLMINIS